MRIKIADKYITDNSYHVNSPYYRQRVLMPKDSDYADYCIETEVIKRGQFSYIEIDDTVKLIRIANREDGKRYTRPIVSAEEVAKIFGMFKGQLWLARFNIYVFNGRGIKEFSRRITDIGYYEGKTWFVTLSGERHRVTAETFELIKSVDEDFKEKYFATKRTIQELKFKKDRIDRLLSLISFHYKQYLEEKLPLMIDAAQRQIEGLRKEKEEIDIEIGDRQAVLDVMIGE